MNFVNGKCPLCGSNTKVPEGQEQCYCQSCGGQILTSAAIAFAAATAAPQQPGFTTQYEQPQAPTAGAAGFVRDKSFASSGAVNDSFAGGGAAGGGAVYNQPPYQYQAQAVGERPLLDKWDKTPMGMAILGFIFPLPALVMSAVLFLVVYLFENGSSVASRASSTTYLAAIVAILVVYCVACGIYALRVYPSLITDKPKIKSPGAAAYWNLAFGGIIFGSLWCSALTNKRESKSQYVFIVLLAISLALSVVSGYTQGFSELAPGTSSTPIASTTNNGNKTNTATTVKTQTLTVSGYADPNTSSWINASGTVSLSSTSVNVSFSTASKRYSVSGEYLRTENGSDIYQMNDGNYAEYSERNGIKAFGVFSDNGWLFDLRVD